MIIRIVKLTLNPAMVEQFLREFDTVKQQIRNFEGCTYTEMLTDSTGNGVVFTYSHWNSPDDLENYRQSDLFKSVWTRVKPMFAARAEAWTLFRHPDNLVDK